MTAITVRRLYIPDISSARKGRTLSKAVQASFEEGINGDRSAQDGWIELMLVRIQGIPLVVNRLWRNSGDRYIHLE